MGRTVPKANERVRIRALIEQVVIADEGRLAFVRYRNVKPGFNPEQVITDEGIFCSALNAEIVADGLHNGVVQNLGTGRSDQSDSVVRIAVDQIACHDRSDVCGAILRVDAGGI